METSDIQSISPDTSQKGVDSFWNSLGPTQKPDLRTKMPDNNDGQKKTTLRFPGRNDGYDRKGPQKRVKPSPNPRITKTTPSTSYRSRVFPYQL